jgi:phosphoglycerate dehydrogenase-like enzyme
VEPVSNLDQLLPSADIVVLTIRLTSETRHRFDRKREQVESFVRGEVLISIVTGEY